MSARVHLYAYNDVTGVWHAERDVSPDQAREWLRIFHRDEPTRSFLVAAKLPKGPPFELQKGEFGVGVWRKDALWVERRADGKFLFTDANAYQRVVDDPKAAQAWLRFFARWRRLPAHNTLGPQEDPGGYETPDALFEREFDPTFDDPEGRVGGSRHKARKVLAYHGGSAAIQRFDRDFSAQGVFWFSENKDEILRGDSGAVSTKYLMTVELTVRKTAGWDEYKRLTLAELRRDFDSVKLGDCWIVFAPKNIRVLSAEEVKKAGRSGGSQADADRARALKALPTLRAPEKALISILTTRWEVVPLTHKSVLRTLVRKGLVSELRLQGRMHYTLTAAGSLVCMYLLRSE